MVATNNPQSYQWRRGGENIAGATGTTLTVNNVQAGDAGSYTVMVGNGVGAVVEQRGGVAGGAGDCGAAGEPDPNVAGSTVSLSGGGRWAGAAELPVEGRAGAERWRGDFGKQSAER